MKEIADLDKRSAIKERSVFHSKRTNGRGETLAATPSVRKRRNGRRNRGKPYLQIETSGANRPRNRKITGGTFKRRFQKEKNRLPAFWRVTFLIFIFKESGSDVVGNAWSCLLMTSPYWFYLKRAPSRFRIAYSFAFNRFVPCLIVLNMECGIIRTNPSLDRSALMSFDC